MAIVRALLANTVFGLLNCVLVRMDIGRIGACGRAVAGNIVHAQSIPGIGSGKVLGVVDDVGELRP